MKLEHYQCKGFTRLGLGQIDSFSMTPSAMMQFILATNGFGKSSLTERFSPLAGEQKLFGKGREEKHFTHRGHHYRFISDFSQEHVHQFWRDGVNLNDGGTVTVQNNLIRYYFNYDNQVHRFIQGRRLFSDMTAAERKELFTRMCDADYEYAIGVHDKVKRAHRSVVGALDIQKKRLVIETAKVIDKEEHARLEAECTELYERVTEMLEQRSPDVQDQTKMEEQFARLVDYSKTRIAALIQQHRKAHRARLRSVEDLQHLRDEIRTEITRCKTLSEHYLKEFERVDGLCKAYEQAKVDSLAGIDKSIRDNQSLIEQARREIVIGLPDNIAPQTVIDSCEQIVQVWLSYTEGLHDNSVKQYNRVTFTELSNKIGQYEATKAQLTERLARCRQSLEHQMQHANTDAIECPKCKHGFHLGYSPEMTEQLKQQLKELTTQLEALETQLKEALQERDAMRAYFQAYSSAVKLFSSAPGMQQLLDYLVSSEVIANQPTRVGSIVQNYRNEAGAALRIEQATKAIHAAEELAARTASEDGSSSDVIERRHTLERDVAVNEQAIQRLVRQEQEVLSNIKLLESIEQQRNELRELQTRLQAGEEALVDNYRKFCFNTLLRSLQSELAQKEQALRASERQLAVIDHITLEIIRLTAEIADYDILVRELSPTQGLIAEGVFSFMKRFVNEVNANLRKIWSYGLVVRPCAVERGDDLVLNYKFPLHVHTDPKPRDDIDQGSDGMVEAINLAFRIAGMKALGMGDFPLILDEYGSKFDAKHKSASVGLLNNLLDTASFPQIFMISHDLVQYGSLDRAQVCVLDAKNIILPPGCVYNQHVVIT